MVLFFSTSILRNYFLLYGRIEEAKANECTRFRIRNFHKKKSSSENHYAFSKWKVVKKVTQVEFP